jgi:hypothetical protein
MRTKVQDIIAQIDEVINCLFENEEEINLENQNAIAVIRLKLKDPKCDLSKENTTAHLEALVNICNTAVNENNGKELLKDPSFFRKMEQINHLLIILIFNDKFLATSPDFYQKYEKFLSIFDNNDDLSMAPIYTPPNSPKLPGFDLARAASEEPFPTSGNAPDKVEDYRTSKYDKPF